MRRNWYQGIFPRGVPEETIEAAHKGSTGTSRRDYKVLKVLLHSFNKGFLCLTTSDILVLIAYPYEHSKALCPCGLEEILNVARLEASRPHEELLM